MHSVKHWLKSPYLLSVIRIVGHFGLAIVAVLVPDMGEHRFQVAGLLVFIIGPGAFIVSLKFNSEKSVWIDPLVDLTTILVVASLFPDLWHLALLIGVVVAQSPSLSIGTKSHIRYFGASVYLMAGMSCIAVLYDIEGWVLPIVLLMAVFPAALLYSYSQDLRVREIRRKADSLTALQLLSGGVAHDFNNILSSIAGYAEYAKSIGFEREATENAVNKILTSTERASALTKQLMSFGEESKGEVSLIDLGQEIKAIVEMLKSTLAPGLEIQVDQAPTSVEITGDRVQINQVLLNLLVNAIEASPSPGVIRIKLEQFGEMIQVEVVDEGGGIAAEIREKLFQPFVTSKANGHGLGLAVVKTIVEDHNGTVNFSEIDEGTRFVVRLPRNTGTVAISSTNSRMPGTSDTSNKVGLQTGTQARSANTILIADDEMPIRVILRQVLEMEGFDVLEAEDGTKFLSLFEQHKEDLCGIVLDIKMPGRTGWKCLDEVRHGFPNLPALVISGFDPEGAADNRSDDYMRFLAKPFRIADVKNAMHDLLDQATRQTGGRHRVS